METLSGDHWMIHVGDVMEGLAAIPAGSVHCVVTSPPYYGLRDYGYDGQIGSEKTPELFVEKMVEVFRVVRRAMRDDGVLFVNLGDSYANDSKWGGSTSGKHAKGLHGDGIGRNRHTTNLPAGNMVGIPWRVAFALQADGWILRKDIIWAKPSPMPESVTGWRWKRCLKNVSPNTNYDAGKNAGSIDRRKVGFNERYDNPDAHAAKYVECSGCDKCIDTNGYVLKKGSWRPTGSHEMIFMFSKSPKYFCDGDGSKEPTSGNAHARGNGVNPKAASIELTSSRQGQSKQSASFSSAVSGIVETRNMRDVWRITPESYKEAHFATYPTELVRRCLIAATSRGGCCSECGSQFAPVVESERVATRTGNNSKVNRASQHDGSPYDGHSGAIVGNRDPHRHTTVVNVSGYLPTCKCRSSIYRPTVLDPFSGSATTGQVAINMGCQYIGIEANPEYAALGVKRLETPWVPVGERKKPKGNRRRRVKHHYRELF